MLGRMTTNRTKGLLEPNHQSHKWEFLMANKVDLAAASTPSLVSILVPCCGMLEYTKLCVPSILRNSRAPIELIFLDIGSLDGTADYLAGIKAASRAQNARHTEFG